MSKSGDKGKMYKVISEMPIRVDMPDGTKQVYRKGDKFNHKDWPMPHVTVRNQLKKKNIEEV